MRCKQKHSKIKLGKYRINVGAFFLKNSQFFEKPIRSKFYFSLDAKTNFNIDII